MHRILAASALSLTLFIAAGAHAQTLTVYDDALQNNFQDYSFGGQAGDINFAATAQVHGGTNSISFIPDNFNAVSFAHPSGSFTTAQYPTLRLWVHGGTGGGQHLHIFLQLNGTVVASAELDPYIAGGGIAAGTWRQATVNITQAPLSYSGSFDRIDLQSEVGAPPPAQPVLYIDDVTLGQPSGTPSSIMQIEHDVTVASMLSDRFTWQDSGNQPRVAVLAHNDNGAGPGGVQGGAMREFRFKLPDGSTRIANVTTYGNGGYGGFGYVVAHASNYAGCVGDDSPLGDFFSGQWQRVFEGRHHAIFRFTQNYVRNCSTTAPVVQRTIPIAIDWMFTTGHDNPLWAVTWNVDQAGPNAPVNTFFDDSRGPYGEFNIDGDGSSDIDGVAWGDRFKFTTTTSPVTLNSDWTWNVANTVPYVKIWINGPIVNPGEKKDATMGIVQTQTMTQQDAGGGRDPNYHDLTQFWGKTSAQGQAGDGYSMPWQGEWPYQTIAFNLGPATSTNNARLTWRTQWGFLGQNSYVVNDGVVPSAPGYPKKSYSTYVVIGAHSTSPVEAQVTQVETVQSLVLSASVGNVVTTGPAGVTRADNVTYQPAGYNHVYGALAFTASGNALDANVQVGSGTLKKPLIIIGNYTGDYPTVKLASATLVADTDYFASLRPTASELWITLNRDLTGATNHIEILPPAGGGVPSAPTGVVAGAVTATRIDITWNAVAGASSYQVDRKAAGGGYTQIATPAGNSYSDLGVSADSAYLYRVRAVNGSGASANSAIDLATTVIFTDAALSGVTVKAAHLAQLRTAVTAVRALAGLGAAGTTDPANAGIVIKAVHVTELRTALDAARGPLGLSTGGYSDGSLGGVAVKAVHFQELRDRVK